MTKKLFLAAICMFALPLFFAPSNRLASADNGSSIAIAGHTGGGQWCQDGTPGCIPDLIGMSRRGNAHQSVPVNSKPSDSGLAFATILLVLGLMIARMRL